MRYESVAAHAFGPFKGQILRLAPGFTLVHGPNEAGKSSWHAALYAGLCGMRRARGTPRRDEQAFTVRHRPWWGTTWEVSAVIELQDGRRVELRHDLLGKVDCRATDLLLGRDCSDEIVNEGAPDGARWLGLDRRSFLATACVRQADLLSALEDAALLQQHLQSSVAAPGADSTAARALDGIERFRAARVGSDRVNSTRPLRQAHLAVEQAHRNLDAAREQHADYLGLVEESERLLQATRVAEKRLLTFRAAQAERDARRARQRADRARELAARYPSPLPAPYTETDRTEDLRRQLALAQQRAVPRSGGPSLALLVAGTAGLALSLVGVALGQPIAAAAVGGLGLALLVFSLLRARRSTQAPEAEDVKRLTEALAVEMRARAQREADLATGRAEWSELRSLLSGTTLTALEAEARQREESLTRLASQVDVGMAAAVALDEDVDARVDELQSAVDAAREAWARARGQADRQLASMQSVAEAEEALATAEAELGHLRQLDATLDTTRRFLEGAQERVHRDVAATLNGALVRWLPRVTAGRYVEARVDPLSLRVDVADSSGAWYQAPLLSHGTAEQVYLLLRVAMAQHLTRAGEVCPLLLDDVTVHADAERERAILETLHALSRERQVVLFSQEQSVLAWAEQHFREPQDALVHLDGPTRR